MSVTSVIREGRGTRRSILLSVVLLALMAGCIDKDNFDSAAQLKTDVATIDAYLFENGLNAYYDKSGVRFVITELGTKGFPPRIDQAIKAKYTGKYLNGTVFDAGPEATGLLQGLILGWQHGLTKWPEGTKGRLFVPSPLGYGNEQVNSIPSNSILTFDIELDEVVLSNAEEAQFKSDTTAITKYLAEHEIDAVIDSTGVRYVITQAGGGAMPTIFSKVKFNYTGRGMKTDTQFFSGSSAPDDSFDSRVVEFFNGIKVALMKIPVGGKITVYIPSGLAFGPAENSQTSLPANSNVIYDIELLEIVN